MSRMTVDERHGAGSPPEPRTGRRGLVRVRTDVPAAASDVRVSWGDGGSRQVLQGRREERARLAEVLAAARGGESRTLVLAGEPGVGKTALLNHLAAGARGFEVSRVAGVQAEMKLAFAGLHRLCAPMAGRLAGLPAPQRDALRTAFGMSAGPEPDHFLVGLAVLGLLAETSRDRPLLCLVDDAQWLDPASLEVLAFAARRLRDDAVAIVLATRVPCPAPALTGLPELEVAGLAVQDARALLSAAVPGPWDGQVLERIADETGGNPRALLEMAGEASAAEFAGGFGPPGPGASDGAIHDIYRRRVARLATGTRMLLLVAAAEPGGDPVPLWRAADRLGIAIEAVTPAVAAGLCHIGDRVRFRHPLARSAAYWTASPQERIRAHGVLAEVTDADADPDRRAWHAAQAAATPDEDLAAGLEDAVGRARARGGAAAAAAFLTRAVELTPDPSRRWDRALAAAHAAHQAGAARAASRMLSVAEAGALDPRRRGRAELLRARIAVAADPGGSAPLLLAAARRLRPQDARLARDAHLEAIGAAIIGGGPAGADPAAAAAAARTAPRPPGPPRPGDLLLDGMARCLTDGLPAGAAALRTAVDAFHASDLPDEDGLQWGWLAGVAAATLWDYGTWDALTDRYVRLVRGTGRAGELPPALTSRIAAKVLGGDLADAAALVAEAETVSQATGNARSPYGALMLAAWQGREAGTAAPAKAVAAEAASRGDGHGPVLGAWATAVLCNGLGRYQDALAAVAGCAGDRPADVATETWVLPEYVEAAVRGGEPERAAAPLRRLGILARTAGTDWALGLHARSQALAATGPAAEEHYREAIDRLGRTRLRGELARARLLYGEWLRRRRQRRPAREQLRTAHEAFTAMGMGAFAERAARELSATGEHVRGRAADTGRELTAHEAQIVRLVREGLTNPEIGARMFISPRTVEWHLRKIFAKLDVTSRKQLRPHPSGV
jgi:DNA-binding CsgD family transcriptional regulator